MTTTTSRPTDADALRERVSEGYTRVLEERSASGQRDLADDVSRRVGYSDEQLAAVPEGANLGVGCGNPTAIDRLLPGETVVDLGSGAGMDAFLAARQVGPTGRVITADVDAAGEHLNALGWGGRRIDVAVSFPAQRARPRRARG